MDRWAGVNAGNAFGADSSLELVQPVMEFLAFTLRAARISPSFSSFSGAPFSHTGPSTGAAVSVSDAQFAAAGLASSALPTVVAQSFAP